jgi:pilus assembly protein Flp/PilA
MGMIAQHLKSFLADKAGATAIEYGLIAALMSVALISGMTAFGDSLVNVFQTIQDNLAP